MKYDYINELGYLALATRLKRISDAMVHSGREMYKSLGLEVEPNWFLIFKLLTKYKQLTITEIASKLHFSHPSVIGLLSKMELNDYLHASADKTDTRKRQFSLTEKALKTLPELEKIWTAGALSTQNMFPEDSDFLNQLEAIEIQLSQSSFMQRTLNELRDEH